MGLNFNNVELPIYTDNFSIPSILFIIGFILGDGTLHLRLRNSDKGSIWLIPTLFLPQLKNKYNAHFFTMLEYFFKSLNIKTYIIKKKNSSEIINILSSNERNIKNMNILTIESISSIFEILLPKIKPYSHYLYWKYNQYEINVRCGTTC